MRVSSKCRASATTAGKTGPSRKAGSPKVERKTPPGCVRRISTRGGRKSNNKTHFGYKNHTKCDAKTKFIRRYRASHASLHDSQCFEELLDEADDTAWADSAYRSKNKPLTESPKRENRKKSQVRVRVEHVFELQTQVVGADRIRTKGIMGSAFHIGLGNLVYNFARLTQLTAMAA